MNAAGAGELRRKEAAVGLEGPLSGVYPCFPLGRTEYLLLVFPATWCRLWQWAGQVRSHCVQGQERACRSLET